LLHKISEIGIFVQGQHRKPLQVFSFSLDSYEETRNFYNPIAFLETKCFLIHQYTYLQKNWYVYKKSTPKFPEKKKELIEIANNLQDSDNPLLMLVKLKHSS